PLCYCPIYLFWLLALHIMTGPRHDLERRIGNMFVQICAIFDRRIAFFRPTENQSRQILQFLQPVHDIKTVAGQQVAVEYPRSGPVRLIQQTRGKGCIALGRERELSEGTLSLLWIATRGL